MKNWQYYLIIAIITFGICLLVSTIIILDYQDGGFEGFNTEENALCKKICERKGYEFVDHSDWRVLENDCKCIDKQGDLHYFSDY